MFSTVSYRYYIVSNSLGGYYDDSTIFRNHSSGGHIYNVAAEADLSASAKND